MQKYIFYFYAYAKKFASLIFGLLNVRSRSAMADVRSSVWMITKIVRRRVTRANEKRLMFYHQPLSVPRTRLELTRP